MPPPSLPETDVTVVDVELQPVVKQSDIPDRYESYLHALRAAWPAAPDVTITFRDLSFEAPIPIERTVVPNVYTVLRDTVMNTFRKQTEKMRVIRPLDSCSGVITPGTMTLIIAPPGHGKSTLLKVLAGRVPLGGSVLGDLQWNGYNTADAKKAGLQLSKLCALVDQSDTHFPMLTVRETFQFALDNLCVDMDLLPSNSTDGDLGKSTEAVKKFHKEKVDMMLEVLGLRECADTPVGNAVMRGISGGQKKRVTLGEMLLSHARALFLDEFSTGLDASATLDITRVLRGWCKATRGSATVALLQPAPEVVALFDQLVLMREGRVVFFGTQVQLQDHLSSMNLEMPPHVDLADWLTNFLSDPEAVWKRDLQGRLLAQRQERKNQTQLQRQQVIDVQAPAADEEPTRVVFHIEPEELEAAAVPPAAERKKGLGTNYVVPADRVPPFTTDALEAAWLRSKLSSTLVANISALETDRVQPDTLLPSYALTLLQYYQPFSRGMWRHMLLNLNRQSTVMARSKAFVMARTFKAIFMGLVLGSLFYNVTVSSSTTASRLGLILFTLAHMGFANMAEVPLANEFKYVVFKQIDASMYSATSYILSVVINHLPLAFAEVLLVSTPIYWMSSFSPDAGRFFFFLLVVFCTDLAVGTLFRTIAYVMKNAAVAENTAGPMNAICMLFGGFLITQNKIPNFLIEFFYLSPFSWALRSAAISEFGDPRYDFESQGQRAGDLFLDTWQVNHHWAYKWAGIGYLLGIFLLGITLSGLALAYKRFPLSVGTRREHRSVNGKAVDVTVLTEPGQDVQIPIYTSSMAMRGSNAGSNASGALTFEAMDLSWTNLSYSVPVPKPGGKGTYDRALLTDVNGYAKAGELTALMGSSGAGKTTLLDVLAGRKTSGTITGQILINGHPQQFPEFARLAGFAEQEDNHIGKYTVRESIRFACQLRLAAGPTEEQRERFIDQILDDLELTPLADRLVGDVGSPGLSPGELKRLTIGVELAANPTFLFLDEPTSGLDSRAALIVVRVIRRIADRGRAVICTIHQPSTELFLHFDRLLLLRSGGKVSYFGSVGEEGSTLVNYFLNADIGKEYYRPSFPKNANPAAWMLDVIGAGTSAKGAIPDYAEVYASSPLNEENTRVLEVMTKPQAGRKQAQFDSVYATPYGVQLREVLRRLFVVYWRDTAYTLNKFMIMVMLSVLFGLVYLQINDNDEAGLNSKLSVIFMGSLFGAIMQCALALPVVFSMRTPFYRERASNTYAPFIYATSLGLVELPFVFVAILLFTIPLYFLVGFASSGVLFWRFFSTLFLLGVTFSYYGQFLASMCPNVQVGNIAQGLSFAFFALFGGVFIHRGSIPAGWSWVYYIDAVPKSLVSIAVQQFECTGVDCPTVTTVDGVITKWEFVKRFMSSGSDWDRYYLAYLVLSIVVTRIIVTLVISKVSHLKR